MSTRAQRTYAARVPPPAVMVEREDVERRLLRAVRLDIAMQDNERSALRIRINWPAYVHDRADLNCQAENAGYLAEIEREARTRRQWDTRAAHDDYLTAMGWLSRMMRDGLAPKRLRKRRSGKRALRADEFCRMVAWGHSFKTIGDEDGSSESQAARRWAGIIDACHAIANGWDGKLRAGRV